MKEIYNSFENDMMEGIWELLLDSDSKALDKINFQIKVDEVKLWF